MQFKSKNYSFILLNMLYKKMKEKYAYDSVMVIYMIYPFKYYSCIDPLGFLSIVYFNIIYSQLYLYS